MAFYYGVMPKSISPCPALITSVLLLSRHSHVYCMRIHLVMNSYLSSSPCCRWQSTRPPLAMSRVHLFLLHRLLLLLLAAPSQKSRHFITEQQMKSGGRAMKKKSIRDTRCDSKHPSTHTDLWKYIYYRLVTWLCACRRHSCVFQSCRINWQITIGGETNNNLCLKLTVGVWALRVIHFEN